MLDYHTYLSTTSEIEAAEITEENIGEAVQNLYDVGCSQITVSLSPRNPQVDDTSYITSISFLHDGIYNILFEGDYLTFDKNDVPVAMTEDQLDADYVPEDEEEPVEEADV